MQYPTTCAVIMGFGVLGLFAAPAAEAGTVLLARESTIRASGTAGAPGGGYNLQDGSEDFNGFADAVDSADAGVTGPRVAANQHSRPSTNADAGFTGAFAEGSATAEADEDAGDTNAEAVSHFDLKFQVLGAPSMINFGGTAGVSGNGSTTICLSNESTGDVVLSQELMPGSGDGQTIEHSTVLNPGVYELTVSALVTGIPSESMAYYTVSLSIAPLAGEDGGGGANPIPLPPALWSAAGVLLAGGAVRGAQFMRARRAK
jgi:hypothetical protein